ncbi:hypothetical protein CVIRNUC_000590 [Coccomyxa viridis]|uniref:Uncharacterized protein n=1 Tax=Coccomyxa viridis TaxID=1274662 RepID=A0AAV1HQQ5_9CHLO|nr:hypothetical protein CVIRNUC_000590 [Coccomyxa viridis]
MDVEGLGPEATSSGSLRARSVEHWITLEQATPSAIHIKLVRAHDANLWQETFTSAQMEELSARAGSFKPFRTFVKMLRSALQGSSDTVSLDVLTLTELLAKSHQRSNVKGAHLHGEEDDAPSDGKRYLILAYKAEFDSIQYPLPLRLDENPTPEFFKSIHRRLHADKEAACQRAAGVPIVSAGGAVLSEDDARLERLVARLREPLQSGPPAQPSHEQHACSTSQLEAAQKRADGAAAALQEERSAHRRVLRHKNRELAEAQEEVMRLKDIIRELRLRQSFIPPRAPLRGRPIFGPSSEPGQDAEDSAQRRLHGRRLAALRGHSRAASPAHAAASARRSCSPHAVLRHRSGSPGKAWFDPTQYVREQRERRRLVAARLHQGLPTAERRACISPGARSAPSVRSGMSSVTSSRPASPHPLWDDTTNLDGRGLGARHGVQSQASLAWLPIRNTFTLPLT